MGDIADGDGLPTTTFPLGYSFQWVRVEGTNETDITGETNSTYTVLAAHEGSTIKVKVSFTDGAGIAETVTSDATAAVIAAAEDCTTDRPGHDWCTTMTVGVARGLFVNAGYSALGVCAAENRSRYL